ncbi:MAG: FtsH protease activity modulator HflK [Oscillospiraceae bacterium]|jgi:membrane protease subunit HflK|nr:FtsH protease activity modulator HflK [Oscillospiraceae bacterium]
MTTKQVKRFFLWSNICIVALIAIILSTSCFYVIEEQEQAVVVTLGKASVVETSGIHTKIPIVQKVYTISMAAQGLEIGYKQTGRGEWVGVSTESEMITSDYNFVNVDFFLEYRVNNPERYMYASSDPEAIFKNMALSYIRDTIGLHVVDEVITTGRNEIQAEIWEKLSDRLEQENIGLQLLKITIQDSEPPTETVRNAFKNVETAKQIRETKINEARKYESEELPAARAQVDATLKEAEAQKEMRINDAKAEVAVFEAMFNEYRKSPAMTRQRMFYEAMEDILPNMKIIIDNGDGTTSKILPLENFTDQEG